MFIPNALETDNCFKVAYSVAALLLFFHDKDFKGKTALGDAFEEHGKYRPVPLSDMWFNILLKHPVKKIRIKLNKILTHQEVRPSALGGAPPLSGNIRSLQSSSWTSSTRSNGPVEPIFPQLQRK
jgi:hypothetical protein